MSKQTINIGASPNDGTGTPLRTSFDYTNQNFTELYTALGGGVGLPGATTQVIFNDGGTNLAGDAGLVYNKTTDALTVAGLVTAGSATITGDLTVRTNKLAVTSTGIGINQATPTAPVHAETLGTGTTVISNVALTLRSQAAGRDVSIQFSDGSNQAYLAMLSGALYFGTGGANTRYQIDGIGISTWSVAGTTAMTLNSTGLGIGVSPGSAIGNLQVGGSTNANLYAQQGTDTIRIGVRASGRTGIILDSSNATYTNRAWYLDNAGSSGSLTIGRQGLDVITFDNVGNVGIGVTPSAWRNTQRALQIGAVGSLFSSTASTGSTYIGRNFYESTAGNFTYIVNDEATAYEQTADGKHIWYNAAAGTGTITFTQAMTLDASGNLFIKKTASALGTVGIENSAAGFIQSTVTSDASLFCNRLATDGETIKFYRQTLQVGNIAVTTLATTYNSISDYRLKEAVQPLVGGLARVSALKPSIYKWKVNGSDGEGFLAHELASVVSAAVTGEKDAVNEDGSINAQSIDMSRIVPILVAAIQELTARVQTLEAK